MMVVVDPDDDVAEVDVPAVVVPAPVPDVEPFSDVSKPRAFLAASKFSSEIGAGTMFVVGVAEDVPPPEDLDFL